MDDLEKTFENLNIKVIYKRKPISVIRCSKIDLKK